MGPTSGGYVPGYQVNARPPKKHRGLKIFGIVMASILGAIALVYFAGVIVFSGRFFPQSTIIGMDISGKTPEEVHQMLDEVLGDYTFKVEGPGLSLTLDATDMGMALDSQSIADGLLAEMNPWAWPYEVFQRHDDTDDLVSTLENSKLADTLTAAVEEANARGTAPKNATVAYDADEGGYVVVPEEEGNTLLADVVIDEVTRGTVNFAPKVTLSDAVLAKPTVTRDDPALAEARDAANKHLGGALSLTMAGAEKMAITADEIAEHITLGDDLSVTFDPEPLVAAVKEKVNAHGHHGRYPHVHASRRQGRHGEGRRLRLDHRQPGHRRRRARGAHLRGGRHAGDHHEAERGPGPRRGRPRLSAPATLTWISPSSTRASTARTAPLSGRAISSAASPPTARHAPGYLLHQDQRRQVGAARLQARRHQGLRDRGGVLDALQGQLRGLPRRGLAGEVRRRLVRRARQPRLHQPASR